MTFAITIIDRAGETLGGFLPRLGGAIVLLVVGVIVARLIARLVTKALHAGGLDGFAERHKVNTTLARVGVEPPVSKLAGRILRLSLTVVVVFAALSLLGLQFLSDSLNEAVLFIPKLLVAALLVLAGVVLAELIRERLDRMTEQMDLPLPLGQLVGVAVLAVFVLTAAAQVGVPTGILTALGAIIVAAAAATVALAFGLGGRDTARAISAGRYVRTAYDVGQTISVDGVRGEIVSLEQTAVVLRTDAATTVRVPNHHLIDSVVSVHS